MLSLTLGRRMAHMMIHDLDCLRIPEIRRLFREELRRLLR